MIPSGETVITAVAILLVVGLVVVRPNPPSLGWLRRRRARRRADGRKGYVLRG